MANLGPLCDRLGHYFADLKLLECALSHRSVGRDNNERLEFLGDAILSYIIAVELYRRYPKASEGDMSRIRSALVNRDKLANLARSLDLGAYLKLGVGEQKSGGQHRDSILADAIEAVIGAVYLDANITACHTLVVQWFDQYFDNLSELRAEKDAKSTLQEWLQANKLPLPTYTAEVSGKAHAQTFAVTCEVSGLPHKTEGKSTNRRKAEQQAAQAFLDLIIDE